MCILTGLLLSLCAGVWASVSWCNCCVYCRKSVLVLTVLAGGVLVLVILLLVHLVVVVVIDSEEAEKRAIGSRFETHATWTERGSKQRSAIEVHFAPKTRFHFFYDEETPSSIP